MRKFSTEQWVPYAPSKVFAFFANPDNLPLLMPRWQHVRLERASYVQPPDAGPGPISKPGKTAAGAGSRMTISFRAIPVLPLRLAWEAEIVEFAWNRFFCDQQRRGPFRYWRHCHRVHEESRGGTPGAIVADEVEYDLPFGPLGALANALVVRKQFELLFAYRQRMLLELLEVSS